jgi:uncharacterized phage infection (PIP) family protein YhgE
VKQITNKLPRSGVARINSVVGNFSSMLTELDSAVEQVRKETETTLALKARTEVRLKATLDSLRARFEQLIANIQTKVAAKQARRDSRLKELAEAQDRALNVRRNIAALIS